MKQEKAECRILLTISLWVAKPNLIPTIFASKKVDWALSFSSISPPATDSYPEYKELKVLPEFKKKIKEKKTVLETIH